MSVCLQCHHPLYEHYALQGNFKCWHDDSHHHYDRLRVCGCKYGAPMTTTPKMYAIRTAPQDGKPTYLGRSARRPWVSGLTDAKLFSKISQARGAVTRMANRGYLSLHLVEFDLVESRDIDESERVADAKRKKELAAENRKKAEAERELRRAEADFKRAQDRVRKLKGKV